VKDRPANPFRGLTPFGREDSQWLFGRDKDVVLMQGRIYSGRTTLLFSGSGVGKTSFLNAKIIPELEDVFDIFYHNSWSGGVEPLDAVQKTLSQAISEKYPGLGDTGSGGTTDQADPGVLSRTLSIFKNRSTNNTKPNGALIIFDQFEEVFSYHAHEEYFKTFLDAVAAVINDQAQPTRIIISMREEFLGELSVFDNRIPDLFGNYYRLKYPDQRTAENIIFRTCSQANVEVNRPNLRELVKDLSKIEKAPGTSSKSQGQETVRFVERDIVAPPYLQIACRKLWEQQFLTPDETSSSDAAFLDNYQPDGARAMLREFISERLSALDPKQQELASRSFDFLVTKQGAKMAYELSQLAKHMAVDEEELEQTLQKLSAPGTRILRESGTSGDHWFELYHDMYGTIVDEWREDYRRRQREDRERLAEEHRRHQRTMWKRILVAGGLTAVLLVVFVSLTFFLARRREQWIVAQRFASEMETLAGRYEALEDRDAALLVRLRVLTALKGRDSEADFRNRLEINRLIGKDYPSLLVTYGESRVTPTATAIFSADGEAVLTQGTDGTIRLWETNTGNAIPIPAEWTKPPEAQTQPGSKEFEGKQAGQANRPDTRSQSSPAVNPGPTETLIRAVVKHPKYQFLIVGLVKEAEDKPDRKLLLWRADNGLLLGAITSMSNWGDFPIFSPDGNLFASGGKTPLLWRIANDTLEPINSIAYERPILPGAFSHDSKYLLTAGSQTDVWDLRTFQPVRLGTKDDRILSGSFNNDGSKVVTVDITGRVSIWDRPTGKLFLSSPHAWASIRSLATTPQFLSDETIVTETPDNSLSFLDKNTGAPGTESFRISGYSVSYRLRPRSNTVLTVSDGVPRLWSLKSPAPPEDKLISVESTEGAGLSSDGTRLITAKETTDRTSGSTSSSGTIRLESINLDSPSYEKSVLAGTVLNADKSYSLSITPSERNNVHVWDIAGNREIARFIYQSLTRVYRFDVSPDRQFLYLNFQSSADSENYYFIVLRINPDQSCALLLNLGPLSYTRDIKFSPDSKYLGAIISDRKSTELAVWALPSMHKISLTEGFLPPPGSLSLIFSNGSKFIAEVANNVAAIWELPAGTPLQKGSSPFTYSSRITVLKFSPNDQYFVAGYEDGTVQAWDVAQKTRTILTNHIHAIQQIEFDSSGERIFIATGLWVHLRRNVKDSGAISSRMHNTNWIPPFRFLGAPGSSRIRVLSSQYPYLKFEDIDFDHPEADKSIQGDPQELFNSWSKKLNRKLALFIGGGGAGNDY
jgi:WD40 repeat protein